MKIPSARLRLSKAPTPWSVAISPPFAITQLKRSPVVARAAASYGYYILPTYPSDLATIQFDRSGTTHIGKYVINHSFIAPGLIGVSSSCVAGYLIAASRGMV